MRISSLVATLLFGAATMSAQAGTVGGSTGVTFTPTISAGAPPDTPGARVDPNTAASPFSGVVSINIRYGGQSFICSGTMVSPTQVLSAAHCVDTDGAGHVVNINQPGNDVRIVFNTTGPNGTAIVTATNVVIHPDYQGFGVCPFAASFQCLNDDISIITIPAGSAPAGAKIYGIAAMTQTPGALFTQVGYGTSGDGVNGYTVGPSFRIKRMGKNIYDVFDTDDEQGFSNNSAAEVWYSDFDGPAGSFDTWCVFAGVCGGTLGNGVETIIGGGDSGGPSFVQDALGNYLLAANNDFSGAVLLAGGGHFGDIYGGTLLAAYRAFLLANLVGANFVPEPETMALMLIGVLGLGFSARRRRA